MNLRGDQQDGHPVEENIDDHIDEIHDEAILDLNENMIDPADVIDIEGIVIDPADAIQLGDADVQIHLDGHPDMLGDEQPFLHVQALDGNVYHHNIQVNVELCHSSGDESSDTEVSEEADYSSDNEIHHSIVVNLEFGNSSENKKSEQNIEINGEACHCSDIEVNIDYSEKETQNLIEFQNDSSEDDSSEDYDSEEEQFWFDFDDTSDGDEDVFSNDEMFHSEIFQKLENLANNQEDDDETGNGVAKEEEGKKETGIANQSRANEELPLPNGHAIFIRENEEAMEESQGVPDRSDNAEELTFDYVAYLVEGFYHLPAIEDFDFEVIQEWARTILLFILFILDCIIFMLMIDTLFKVYN